MYCRCEIFPFGKLLLELPIFRALLHRVVGPDLAGERRGESPFEVLDELRVVLDAVHAGLDLRVLEADQEHAELLVVAAAEAEEVIARFFGLARVVELRVEVHKELVERETIRDQVVLVLRVPRFPPVGRAATFEEREGGGDLVAVSSDRGRVEQELVAEGLVLPRRRHRTIDGFSA